MQSEIAADLKAIRGLLERSEERQLHYAENAKQRDEEMLELTVKRTREEVERLQESYRRIYEEYKQEHLRRFHPELAKPTKPKPDSPN